MSDPVDHTAVALARLPHYMRSGASNTEKVLSIILAPGEDFETAAQQALAMLNVNTAVGVHLDRIGAKVGCPREGIADDEIYRRYIRAQIIANKSDGVIADINKVADLVIWNDDAHYRVINTGAAAFYLEVRDCPVPDDVAAVLFEMMRKATAAGVRSILVCSPAPVGDELRWGTGKWGTRIWARAIDKES